jgi:hypothetical protein
MTRHPDPRQPHQDRRFVDVHAPVIVDKSTFCADRDLPGPMNVDKSTITVA